MLTRRLIPCLDVRDGRVVKGTRFLDLQDVGDPVELARRYEAQGADELAILDITATVEGRLATMAIVERCADELSIPLTVGGGVKAIEDVRRLLAAGADKVAMNSAAVRDPALIEAVAREFGSQCVVLAIDARGLLLPEGEGRGEGEGSRLLRPHPTSAPRSSTHDPVSRSAPTGSRPSGRGVPSGAVASFVVVIDGGRTATERDAIAWAREGASRGAGEILLTSMDRDGTGAGFDLELTRAVARAVAVPVIASGGARSAQDFLDVFSAGEADAALAAGILHRGETTVAALKAFLREKGIEVRP